MAALVGSGTARRGLVSAMTELVVNVALPYAIYVALEPRIGTVHALMSASLPPIVWSVVGFIRQRRIDAVSMIVLAGIALSLLAFLGGGSVRFLQLRENLVTGVIGVVFLGSAAIGRPLIYQLARARELRKSAAHGEAFDSLREHPRFRRIMMTMTLVWGFGLVGETAVACALVFTMPIRDYLLASPFLAYGWMGALLLWSFWYPKHQRRLADAARN